MTERSSTIQRIVYPVPGVGLEAALGLYVAADPDHLLAHTRDQVTISAGGCATWATYFGAVPLGWWREGTSVRSVRLSLSLSAPAALRVHRSDGEGRSELVAERVGAVGTVEVDIEAGAAEGWAWFDVAAQDAPVTVSDAEWSDRATTPPAAVTATVCVTTHNRVDDCLALLRTLAEEGERLSALTRIVVADQSDRPLRGEEGFDEVQGRLGDRLRVIRQPNLGGSGGFTRGMFEAVREGSDYALLLDDDVRLEPESVLRMLRYAARTPSPAIVGAQMLNLAAPTRLHSFGERISRPGFWWTPVDDALVDIEISGEVLRARPGLHRVRQVDFNGWWMCAVPAALIRSGGGALPFFIKWDDVEFALRARDGDVRTVTLPGAAVWHAAWTGKDDGLDWQAYFQLRNRIVTALLHAESITGVIWRTLAADLNHLVCQQYGSIAVRTLALRDVLGGPRRLRDGMVGSVSRSRAVLKHEGQLPVRDDEVPPVRGRGRVVAAPVGRAATVRRALRVLAHQVVPTRPRPDVEARLSRAQGKWWAVGLLPRAAVSSATGHGAFVSRRRPVHAAALLAAAVGVRIRLTLVGPRIRAGYRRSLQALASPASWAPLFDGADPSVPDTE